MSQYAQNPSNSSTQMEDRNPSPMSNIRRVWIASDHAGYDLKALIIDRFNAIGGFKVQDEGPYDSARVDYPKYAWPLAQKVAEANMRGEDDFGILICGTGIGVSLVANQHPEIRAALAHNLFTAEMARRHNDANILCIGARVIGQDLAIAMVERFAMTSFDGGRHQDRLELMRALAKDV